MPADSIGQQYVFATEIDPDEQYSKFIWIRVTHSLNTIRKIAASRGHPELAREIAKLNKIRSVTAKLKKGKRLRLPGTLEQKLEFSCYPQDGQRPIIKDGYAIFDVFNRYGEKGLTHFKGYNPEALDVPIAFEGWGVPGAGARIMDAIRILERMAGRGRGFKGAASGPPAVIRVSVTDNQGNIVPLISPNAADLWRVNGIDWNADALSDPAGRIVRAAATVHLSEHTPVNIVSKVTDRSKASGPTPTKVVDQRRSTH